MKGAREKGTRVRGSISKGLHLREGQQKSFDTPSKIGAREEEKILKITGRDFISRYFMMQSIADYDKKLITSLKNDKLALVKEKEQLEARKEEKVVSC